MLAELQAIQRITVLLVADEVLVRNFLNAALSGEGYLALSAANAVEALELAAAFAGRIQLLLSFLPEAHGLDLARTLASEYSGIRALVASSSMRTMLAGLAGSGGLPDRAPAPAVLTERIRRLLAHPDGSGSAEIL